MIQPPSSMRRAAVEHALREARQRDTSPAFIGQAELYCETTGCSIRTVTLAIKEFNGPTTPAALVCPACRHQLKPHDVRTRAEQHEADEAEARRSVNVQRYRREHPDALTVPLGMFLNERLP